LLDRARARPGALRREARDAALVFPVDPRLLIFRRIEVVMGVDQAARCALPRAGAARQHRGEADCFDELPARLHGTTSFAPGAANCFGQITIHLPSCSCFTLYSAAPGV